MKRIRYYIFLRDVAWLSIAAFGGPQVHIALFIDMFVKKRGYLKEKEFLELNALCQILPGPTSTQTIVALGFKIGGPNLAYLTLLVWALPAMTIMTALGIAISFFNNHQSFSLDFLRFVQPLAVGLVCYAAYRITRMVVNTKTGVVLLIVSTACAYAFKSPFVFPVVVVFGGMITAFRKFKHQPKEQPEPLKIEWANFLLYLGVMLIIGLGVLVIGVHNTPLWVRLFENFYRNGSFIFGGGQVLIPVLFTEFVEFKAYLTEQEFLSGFGLAQCVPGPVFSFVSFIGALSMREAGAGIGGEIWGAFVAAAGIFLPGTFLIFFVIRFWEQLKKYRVVKASLEGIHAASSGLVIAAALLLLMPIITGANNYLNITLVIFAFLMLTFTKVKPPWIILCGLLAGIIF
jgi:chromate transporter